MSAAEDVIVMLLSALASVTACYALFRRQAAIPKSEIAIFPTGQTTTTEFRITRQHGRIIGVEQWKKGPGPDGYGETYGYTVWKGHR